MRSISRRSPLALTRDRYSISAAVCRCENSFSRGAAGALARHGDDGCGEVLLHARKVRARISRCRDCDGRRR